MGTAPLFDDAQTLLDHPMPGSEQRAAHPCTIRSTRRDTPLAMSGESTTFEPIGMTRQPMEATNRRRFDAALSVE
jgi:hypothetical protein